MDSRTAQTWASYGQLYTGPGAAGSQGTDPLPDIAHRGAGCRGQPGAEDPGRSQYQAGLGGIGCYGDFGEGYPCGSHSRLDGCSGHGGAGPGEAAPEAARAQAGPGGTDGGSPALYADRATGAYRRPG